MTPQRPLWTWLGWGVFFLAWGFIIHGAGLVLHEVGGHGIAAMIVGCGVDRFELTYFGRGQTFYTPCPEWTWRMIATMGSAGLVVTIATGTMMMALQRRATRSPLTRLLIALLATWFLLGDLAYATLGGFHDVYDPAPLASALDRRGLHVLAWLPPLVLFTASAVLGARAIVDAFRACFGARSRLHALQQMMATLGTAGLSYFVARHVERFATTYFAHAAKPVVLQGVMARAEEIAVARGTAPPFPIHRVLIAIGVAAFVFALARPVVGREGADDSAPPEIPRRHAVGVGVAALVCFVVISLLTHVPAARSGL